MIAIWVQVNDDRCGGTWRGRNGLVGVWSEWSIVSSGWGRSDGYRMPTELEAAPGYMVAIWLLHDGYMITI